METTNCNIVEIGKKRELLWVQELNESGKKWWRLDKYQRCL